MHERRVKKLKGGHYVATHGRLTPDPPYVHSNRGYSTDGEESHRAPSERTISEYTMAHERTSPQGMYNSSRKARLNGTNGGGGGQANGHSLSRHHHHHHHQTTATSTQHQNGNGRHRSPATTVVDSPSANGTGTRSLSGGPPPPTRLPPRAPSLSYDQHGGDASSDVYVTSGAYKAPSEISRYSHNPSQRPQSRSAAGGGPRSVYSVASTAKTGRSARSGRSTSKRGAKIETMSAPNPFCPNTKGVCCLMLLLNLGIILVTLGFVIVVQLHYDPLYIWVLGVVFLVFGFLTLIGCMVYCVHVCRNARTPSQVRNEDLYWTRHWQKNIGYTPQEINYKSDKYDYSDRYSVGKMSGKYSDRESMRY